MDALEPSRSSDDDGRATGEEARAEGDGDRVTAHGRVEAARFAGLLGAGTLLARILGLVRDVVIAYYLGTGKVADAWLVAFRIPNVIRVALTEGAVSSALVPVFNRYLENRPREEAKGFLAASIGSALVLFGVLALAGMVFAPVLTRVLSPGFGAVPGKLELTASLMRWTFVYTLFLGIASVCMGALQSLGSFGTSAASASLFNVGILLAVFTICPLFGPTPERWVFGLMVGAIVSGVAQLLIQLRPLAKRGMLVKPRVAFGHPGVVTMWRLMPPSFVGVGLTEISVIVSTFLGSLLAQGAITTIELAGRTVQVPYAIVGAGLATALLPLLSRQAARNDMAEFERTLSMSLRVTVFLMMPLMVLTVTLAPELVRALLERGAFTAESTARTARALAFFAPFLLGGSLLRVASAAFFALQDTRTPLKAALASLFFNTVVGYALMKRFDVGGLALANGLSFCASAGILLVVLARRIGGFSQSGWPALARTTLTGSLLLGTSVLAVKSLATPAILAERGLLDRVLAVAFPAVVGIALYVGFALASRSPELGYLRRVFPRPSVLKGSRGQAAGQ